MNADGLKLRQDYQEEPITKSRIFGTRLLKRGSRICPLPRRPTLAPLAPPLPTRNLIFLATSYRLKINNNHKG